MHRKKHCSLTLLEKQKLKEYLATSEGSKSSLSEIREYIFRTFKKIIHPSTVSKLRKHDLLIPETIQLSPSAMRLRTVKFPAFDRAVYEWFLKFQDRMPLTDALILTTGERYKKRLKIKNLQLSNGWLHSFKQRYNITVKMLSGESGSANTAAARNFIENMELKLSNFNPNFVFNTDETGLFFRMEPSKTLSTTTKEGRKKRKDRITLVLTTNMTGTVKLPLYVIGKSQRPRALRNINIDESKFIYRSNKKAWLYSHNFEEVCLQLNQYCEANNEKGALICDNVSTHFIDPELELTHLEIIYLPPNTTSILQPLDAGIIRSIKAKYRKQYLMYILDELECDDSLHFDEANKQVSLLHALEWVSEAWEEISPQLIQNCWKKVNLLKEKHQIEIEEEEELQEIIDQIPLQERISSEEYSNPFFEREGGETEDEDDIVDSVAAIFDSHIDWDSDEEEGENVEESVFPSSAARLVSATNNFSTIWENKRVREWV
ncbi:hypothetical protein RCL1_007169 [Eukaryota sp. TZLM3-RCL]